jgi:hypothetical protein
MRRAAIVSSMVVALLASAVGQSAAAGPAPRGVLTKTEYSELHAVYESIKHAGRQQGTPTSIARHSCRYLTNASRLTSAERAECEASLIFTYRFFAFPYAAARCAKAPTAAGRRRCLLPAVGLFARSVNAFIRTNSASLRAVAPRHFSRRCLDYLVFTPDQSRTTTALADGLRRYAAAVRRGSADAVTTAVNRVDNELVASRQAMSFSISLSACRHQ